MIEMTGDKIEQKFCPVCCKLHIFVRKMSRVNEGVAHWECEHCGTKLYDGLHYDPRYGYSIREEWSEKLKKDFNDLGKLLGYDM